MAVNVLKLKKQAVAAGMPRDDARAADRKTLEAFISKAAKSGSSEPTKKTPAKKTPVAKKKAADEGENKPAKKPTKRTAAKKQAEKPERKQARKPAKKQARKAPAASENGNGDANGRLSIGRLDWKATSEEWNPKTGGPVEKLFRALKTAKGDIDKAYEIVRPQMYDFVGRKKRNGEKRTKPEAEMMLRYRLNRTKYEFAVRTGQHEQATERVEYGTGQYATTRRKDKRRGPRKKAENTAPAKKQERKPASKKPGGRARKKNTTETAQKRKPGQKRSK